MKFLKVVLICWALVLFIGEAMGFTVFFKTEPDGAGRHKILLAVPQDVTLPEPPVDAGISSATFTDDPDNTIFDCIHEWTNKRQTGRYYLTVGAAGTPEIMESESFTFPQGSLRANSPLCILPQPGVANYFVPVPVTTSGGAK